MTPKKVKFPGILARVGKLILVPVVGALLMNVYPNFQLQHCSIVAGGI